MKVVLIGSLIAAATVTLVVAGILLSQQKDPASCGSCVEAVDQFIRPRPPYVTGVPFVGDGGVDKQPSVLPDVADMLRKANKVAMVDEENASGERARTVRKRSADSPEALSVSENLFWEHIAPIGAPATTTMPTSNYTDFQWRYIPGRFRDYLAASINVVRQQIVAEGKVQVNVHEASGAISTVKFDVPKAERLSNLKWHSTLERMAIGAALALEMPKFRQLADGYELNGHIAKVMRYASDPDDLDDQQMLEHFKQLLSSAWASGQYITPEMIEDEHTIPMEARPFQSLVSGRTKSVGCGVISCRNHVGERVEYVRVYVCMFNGRMTVKDKYETMRPLYQYDGMKMNREGTENVEFDHIPVADSELMHFIEGRKWGA